MAVISKQTLKKLGDKEMDRKDFLKYSGIVLIGVVGLKGIITLLTQADNPQLASRTTQTANRGFGGGKYGA